MITNNSTTVPDFQVDEWAVAATFVGVSNRRGKPRTSGFLCGLLFLIAGFLLVPPCPGAPFTFSKTGNLATARFGHTTTLLSNGKVLVVGGWAPRGPGQMNLFTSAELYDPATGKWTPTGSLAEGRAHHTATLLRDGRVLVAGGYGRPNDVNRHTSMSAELYDPATGTWTATGDLAIRRCSFTATLLPNGKVLAVGCFPNTAELYDPATGIWTASGNPTFPHYSHTATLLANGKVLIVGSKEIHDLRNVGRECDPASAELYDPATETWTTTGNLIEGRGSHTATLLSNGKVLVVGGDLREISRASVELYDPATGTWTNTHNLTAERTNHTATLLQNGKVLIVGGNNRPNVLASGELYDPVTGIWTAVGSIATGRSFHAATLLSNGSVLIVGGSGPTIPGGPIASTEIYGPSETPGKDGSTVSEPATAQ